MPKTETKSKRKRLSLDLTPKVKLRIENLRELTETESITEVVRRALASYELLCEAQASGKSILVRDSNGEESSVILLK